MLDKASEARFFKILVGLSVNLSVICQPRRLIDSLIKFHFHLTPCFTNEHALHVSYHPKARNPLPSTMLFACWPVTSVSQSRGVGELRYRFVCCLLLTTDGKIVAHVLRCLKPVHGCLIPGVHLTIVSLLS